MFDAQVFGGISRYFVNLINGIKDSPAMEVETSVLFTRNHYLKATGHWKMNNLAGKVFFSKAGRIPKWNKNYSKYLLRKGGYDLFHPTYYHTYFLKLLKGPFVLTIHDMIYELYPGFFDPTDLTAVNKKLLISKAAHLIAISETTKIDLIKILDVPEDKITVVYHGHTPAVKPKNEAPELPKKYILFVGGRDHYKNFKTFAIAAAAVIKMHLDVQIICAGGGSLSEEENDYLRQLGIIDKVIQYNASDELLYWLYRRASIFVYPSMYEGFGLPVLEAFEAECPVVLSDTPSFKEVAQDAAVYFSVLDPVDMAKVILEVLDQARLKDELVVKGRIRLKEFTMEKCIRETIEVYKKCLQLQ